MPTPRKHKRGRPRLPLHRVKSRTVSCRATAALLARLREAATAAGCTPAHMLGDALQAYMDAARAAHVRAATAHASTNPQKGE